MCKIKKDSNSFVIGNGSETNTNDVTIEVYNSSKTLVKSSTNTIDLPVSSSSTTYYIAISGSRTMNFKFVKN